jgi:hypothetical protein
MAPFIHLLPLTQTFPTSHSIQIFSPLTIVLKYVIETPPKFQNSLVETKGVAISTKSAIHVSSGILKLGRYDQGENGEGGGEWESGLGWIDLALINGPSNIYTGCG